MKTNPKRAPYSEKVKARVREMREQGYSNVQITEATGVPTSTIARWAAEGGWRVSDLVNAISAGSRDPFVSHGTGSGLLPNGPTGPGAACPTAEPLEQHASTPVQHCACVVTCIAPRSEGCRMNPPVELEAPPDGLLPGLNGEGWNNEERSFLRRQESGPVAEARDPRLRGDERDGIAVSDDARASSVFSHDARAGSSASLGRAAPAHSLVRGSTPPSEMASPQANAQAQGVEPKAKNKPEQSRQQQLEDALERAAIAAEDAILRSNFTAAAKATQMADSLSRALERVRNSAPEEKPDGVFYTREDIEAARADLTRRFDRLAKTLRVDEMMS